MTADLYLWKVLDVLVEVHHELTVERDILCEE